jgi:hypothetical protein
LRSPLSIIPAEISFRLFRNVYLGVRAPSDEPANDAAFHRGLAEHGYVEGQNVAIEYRVAGSQYDRFPAFAAELARRPVTVFITCLAEAHKRSLVSCGRRSGRWFLRVTLAQDDQHQGSQRRPSTGLALAAAMSALGERRHKPVAGR